MLQKLQHIFFFSGKDWPVEKKTKKTKAYKTFRDTITATVGVSSHTDT